MDDYEIHPLVMAALFFALSDTAQPNGLIKVDMLWPYAPEEYCPASTELGNLRLAQACLNNRIAMLEGDSGDVAIGVPTARMGLQVPGS